MTSDDWITFDPEILKEFIDSSKTDSELIAKVEDFVAKQRGPYADPVPDQEGFYDSAHQGVWGWRATPKQETDGSEDNASPIWGYRGGDGGTLAIPEPQDGILEDGGISEVEGLAEG